MRLIYIGYYIKNTNWTLFRKFILYTSDINKRSILSLSISMIYDVVRYNISFLEYFQFRFFEKAHEEKLEWAGTGYMYEYQLRMNPKKERYILDDKRIFARYYKEFMIHKVEDERSIQAGSGKIEQLLQNATGKIVLKAANGKCGAQVAVADALSYTPSTILHLLQNSSYDLVEEFIVQHPSLQALSPSAVNTVRIFTQLTESKEVVILGCRLRISINSKVDNLAAGNLAAPIDEKTGVVYGPGVYSDITKPEEHTHPVTGLSIQGFQVPFWKESIDLVKQAATKHPQNRSIGWDVAITEHGPGLIEGNHDWCKLLWQLPVQKGLKSLLKHYEP